jgi:hypothetical protein
VYIYRNRISRRDPTQVAATFQRHRIRPEGMSSVHWAMANGLARDTGNKESEGPYAVCNAASIDIGGGLIRNTNANCNAVCLGR